MEINGEISYKLDGNINFSYKDRIYNITKARFTILLGENDVIINIKLVAKFLESSCRKLSNYFDGLKACENGYLSYSFLIKEQVLEENSDKFLDSLDLESFLKVQEGACLKLDNYDFQGYAEV